MPERSALISEELVRRLLAARFVVALTGAGVSAESGIRTFRDEDGHWSRMRPEELASSDGFRRNPGLVQTWYAMRRAQALSVEPNPAHVALAAMENLFPEFRLITQNVDNLHRRAGSKRVIELHGNIMRSYCSDCGLESERPLEGNIAELESRTLDLEYDTQVPEPDVGPPLQSCPACGGLIRPDVVWFGEMLPSEAISAAFALAERAEVFLSIGTSAEVYPAAGLPHSALSAGAYLVEVNPRPTAITGLMHESIRAPAGAALPVLLEAARHKSAGRAGTPERDPV